MKDRISRKAQRRRTPAENQRPPAEQSNELAVGSGKAEPMRSAAKNTGGPSEPRAPLSEPPIYNVRIVQDDAQPVPVKVIEGDARGQRTTPPADVSHSDDFRSVRWYGTDYVFTPTQAACVRVLWEAWERGTPVLGQDSILEHQDVGSAASRLYDVFQKGKHPAWGKMIVSPRKGAFCLAKPT
jgi:hypothetical protein